MDLIIKSLYNSYFKGFLYKLPKPGIKLAKIIKTDLYNLDNRRFFEMLQKLDLIVFHR